MDLNQKNQIVKPVKTAEPPSRTTGKVTYEHVYAQMQCTCHDPKLLDKDKNENYMSVNPADLNFVYNQLVTRFISVFCSNPSQVPVTYNTDSLRQGVREYIALGSKDIGRLGCF